MTSHSMSSDTPEAKLADGFTAGAFHGALPMIIWAAHFFVAYASAEVACALQLLRFKPLGLSAPSLWLWAITAAAIAWFSVGALTAQAQDISKAQDTGRVERVDRDNSVLIISDIAFSIAPTTKIYALNGTRTSLNAIRPGMNIAFTVVPPKNGGEVSSSREFSEIWIMPAGGIKE
jgi:hypothetical protein